MLNPETPATEVNALRSIERRVAGEQHGPIARLISPGDLGERLKPFIFLDFFDADIEPGFGFGMHPHSGIATGRSPASTSGSLSGLPANAPIARGGCITANALYVPGSVSETLNQDNVPWRVGAEWTPFSRTLFYANVSKGYKAGGFPDLGATTATQYIPASQESILAYEAGFKTMLIDHTLQLNGAVFYYDYRDKQILGRTFGPLFGPLLKLINVPKSDIKGAEL